MEHAHVRGTELEYTVVGSGEPVVFVHGAFIAEMFKPLLSETALTDHYQLILYHRRGYRGSEDPGAPITVPEHASDCAALLHHLDIHRAHIVGQSYGGAVAVQLALDMPELVQSLALLEPALAIGDTAQDYRDALANSVQRFREEGAASVLDEFLEARSPGYRALLDRELPGVFETMLDDAPAVFEFEISALPAWQFDENLAREIRQPVLSVLGGASEALWPRFGETHRLLLDWLPRAEGFLLPDTTHLMLLEAPGELAEALAAFWSRHPIAGP